ncbi:PLP-dependent aminotransferase family protein [Nocardioides sp. GY 10113]|uniref:MocR-like transcription factor YczR n=1 Tax=Nocardioides sp. GY 10113 TaxID=2569761 RepID=UPI001F0E1F27|nr:PLP-dependent aminotransferase family protein [Nocardioides sp. GY 10113]
MAVDTVSPRRLADLVGDFDREPAYVGLADALRELIGDGRIGYGTRLPSERDLTAALGVSRTTVTRAYGLLRETAYAEARQGAGTFTRLPGGPLRARDRALTPGLGGTGTLDLVCAAATAPPGIAAHYQRAVEDLPAHLGTSGYYPAGMPELQAAIAATYDARGLPTAPEQIIVTPGALAATAVVGSAVAGPRDRILIDSPTYPNATQALRTGGGRLTVAPLEADGWDLETLGAVITRQRPAAAYLMPDFHNPTGLVLPAADRADLAARLRATGTVPIVDEAHHALRLDGQDPLPPFASLHPRTITVGSASKSIWGGLRLGWIRAPRDLVEELTVARIGLDLGAPVLEQLVLARILADGADELIAANRARLRDQRDALVEALREHLPEWTFRVPSGGMALWCRLPSGDSTRLVDLAERHGVMLAPGPVFAPAGGLNRHLRMIYTLTPDDLREAVRRIAGAWAELGAAGADAGRRRRTSAGPVLVA